MRLGETGNGCALVTTGVSLPSGSAAAKLRAAAVTPSVTRPAAAVAGRRNFTGVMRAVAEGKLQLEIEGGMVSIELANIDKARLVPRIEF